MRTILVTGGAKRIGKSIVNSLAEENNRILIHYNNSIEEAQKLRDYLIKKKVNAQIYKADLSNSNQIMKMIDQIDKDCNGELDTLINCASIFEFDSARDFSNDRFSNHININLLAPLLISKHIAQTNDSNNEIDKNIINIIDQRVLRMNPSYFSYSISKFALWGATQMMAQEYSPLIRVNAVAPGPILANNDQSEDDFAEEANNTPLQKQPDIKDISNAIKFILSTRSVTGQIIAIDSGQHLSWKTPDYIEVKVD